MGSKASSPRADFDWSRPAKIERDIIERALTLDSLGEARNLVMVGRNGLGLTGAQKPGVDARITDVGEAMERLASYVNCIDSFVGEIIECDQEVRAEAYDPSY